MLLNPDGAEAEWPEADVIIGNPPFLGTWRQLDFLGEKYVKALRNAYAAFLAGNTDYVLYWFEKAARQLSEGKVYRVGLVGTNSIRGGANRTVLKKILDKGRFFEAWSDEPWVVEGAAVRVSILCYDNSPSGWSKVDGRPVTSINSDLTAGDQFDLTTAIPLRENSGLSFL